MSEQRIVNLEVNEKGSWRRVTSFDLSSVGSFYLADAADHLLSLSDNPKLTARITRADTQAPLMIWSRTDGWREWGVG